jgi:hypothetical protein
LISNLIIEDWGELKCQMHVVDLSRVMWFWDLTCDFWAENGKRKLRAAGIGVE